MTSTHSYKPNSPEARRIASGEEVTILFLGSERDCQIAHEVHNIPMKILKQFYSSFSRELIVLRITAKRGILTNIQRGTTKKL